MTDFLRGFSCQGVKPDPPIVQPVRNNNNNNFTISNFPNERFSHGKVRIREEFSCVEMYPIVQESMHIVNVLMYLDLWLVRRAEGGDNATRQSSFATAPASRPSCPPEGGGRREGGLRTSGLRATASAVVRKILW